MSETIGFCGLGRMGLAMVKRLLAAGFDGVFEEGASVEAFLEFLETLSMRVLL